MANPQESLDAHHPLFAEGAKLFDAGRWFDAHEAWEDLWNADRTPERMLWQALIMVAVALEHWQRGNLRGAQQVWRKADRRLAHFAAPARAFDAPRFHAAMQRVFAPLDAEANEATEATEATGRSGDAPAREAVPRIRSFRLPAP